MAAECVIRVDKAAIAPTAPCPAPGRGAALPGRTSLRRERPTHRQAPGGATGAPSETHDAQFGPQGRGFLSVGERKATTGPGRCRHTSVPQRSINGVAIISRCSLRGWSVRATGGDRPASGVANTANNVDRINMKTFGLTVGIWGCIILYRYCCLRARKPGRPRRCGSISTRTSTSA